MGIRVVFEEFVEMVSGAGSPEDLTACLEKITARMGYDYFALTHHVDILTVPHRAIRLHNYPGDWVEYFDVNALGAADPIHRASQRTAVGFPWNRVGAMIPLTRDDHRILSLANEHGIGEGFTVPANVPGEAHGSCSFAMAAGRRLPEHNAALAQLAGAFAFEGARRVYGVWQPLPVPAPTLTDRQRECLIWAARGKTDWETSRILGISEETVAQHIRQACDRYGVQRRTSLMIHALFDGTISFADIPRR
jgi:LuxR family quorum-sensing system transcriptional regulator CciR